MKFLQNYNKKLIVLFSLAIVFVTIPAPKYNINSQSLIFYFFTFLFFSNKRFSESFNIKKVMKLFFLSLPFFITAVGCFYSDHRIEGFKYLLSNLPFLLFPITFFYYQLDKKKIEWLLNYFVLSVLFFTLFGFLKALWFFKNNLGDYYFYDKFALLLNKHSTYFSLLIVLSIVVLFNKWIEKNKLKLMEVFIFIFFTIALYMLSVRISFIALLFGTSILLFFKTSKRVFFYFTLIIPFLVSIVFISPNIQKRFQKSNFDNGQIDDTSFRLKHWESVIETVKDESLFFGIGTKGNNKQLIENYKKRGLTAAYERSYNAHNQFLEFFLNQGLVGLVLFILGNIMIFRFLYSDSNYLGLCFFTIFITYMLTESILMRHSGIISYSLFLSVLLFNTFEKKNYQKNYFIKD